ncbi:MAG: hypothetical protein PUJ80_09145, partial [Verrucomicrobiota bacterium]|nr:hypothetical protein [Verrucomicrobiota bacterium]
GQALRNIPCETIFTTHTGNWNDMSRGRLEQGVTNADGDFRFKGESDVSHVTFSIHTEGVAYYPVIRKRLEFSGVSGVLSRHWEPYDSIVTVRLQRVEHPIPLFVKRVELRDYERGIGGFDGTNSVLRFDLMKGDWLPPYGKGEVADMRIDTRVDRTETERRFLPQDGQWGVLQFYDFVAKVELHDGDYLLSEDVRASAGIKIRSVVRDGSARSITRTKGKRKQIDGNKDWRCEYFSDSVPNRCYTFRIRTRRNDKGELVEAYYGKIYGDFEFEGDDKKGLIGVKFLYYLNPKSLDRNLEWDRKTNLCPTAGKHESQEP